MAERIYLPMPAQTSIEAILRDIGSRGIRPRRNRFHFQLDTRGRTFIFVDQHLKLCRECCVGCANRKALEEKGAIMHLLALLLFERFFARLFHHAPRESCCRRPLSRHPRAQFRAGASGKTCQPFELKMILWRRNFRIYCGGDNSVAVWRATSLRESLWQTRQMALDICRPLTPNRS